MRLGYVILYVADVVRAVDFYERAFGLEQGFVSEEGHYAELQTGETTLAFATYGQAASSLGSELFRRSDPDEPPPAFEIALVADDVEAAFQRALREGARSVAGPAEKPWGQTVAYVRDPDGVLVELCSAMA